MTKAPIALQELRRRIYRKAKSEKAHRFWGIFVHVTRTETLEEAYRIAKRNGGAAGIDGQTFATIETAGPQGPAPRQFLTRQLFFKWIKQHLRIKQFYGTSDNAVRTQIWIAVSVYVLVAIVKKRLGLEASLYTLLQVFSVTLFEKMPMSQAFPESTTTFEDGGLSNQLNLFDY